MNGVQWRNDRWCYSTDFETLEHSLRDLGCSAIAIVDLVMQLATVDPGFPTDKQAGRIRFQLKRPVSLHAYTHTSTTMQTPCSRRP